KEDTSQGPISCSNGDISAIGTKHLWNVRVFSGGLRLGKRLKPGGGFSESRFSKETSGVQPPKNEVITQNAIQERPCALNESSLNRAGSSSPTTKGQVVGWPPIRSFRKNTLAPTSKNNQEVDIKSGSTALFIKVSMDGAPYLRKVDLRTYYAY
ncbi:auxin-responsive protein, partial [Datura stramonium]|nr:auxin-responsive protein [Datura stramonium]